MDAIIKAVLTKQEDTPSEATTKVTLNISNNNKADLSKLPAHVKSMVQTLISNNSNIRTINFAEHRHFHNASTQTIFKVTVDGGADTCLDGEGHIFLEYTERSAHVIGFDKTMEKKDLRIGMSTTTTTLPSGEKILLLKNEAIDHTQQFNSMLTVHQVRAYGIDIDDCPTC